MRLQLDSVEQALRREIRVALSSPESAPEALAQLGLSRLTLPLEVGGLDLGLGAAAVAWEELGRHLAPSAVTDTLLAADTVAAAGIDEAAADWLEAVAAGRASAVLVGLRDAELRLREERVSGRSEAVPIPAAPPDVFAAVLTPRGPTLFRIVRADADAGFSELEGSRGLGRYDLRAAGVDRRVGNPGAASGLIRMVLPATRIRHAAYVLGIVEHMLALTVRHVHERQQFGKRLVDFQSVSLRLAEIRARIEGVRMLVHHAAWRRDDREEADTAAEEALAAAAELALRTSRTMMQLHGAGGMLMRSAAAAAYETVAREAVRLGAPPALWREAGLSRLGAPSEGRPRESLPDPQGVASIRQGVAVRS